MSTETNLMTFPGPALRRRSDTRLLEARLDRLQMTVELLRARIALLAGATPPKLPPPEELVALATAISPSTHRRYGAALVGEAFDVARATIFRQKRAVQLGRVRKRPGPKTQQSDEQLLVEMVHLIRTTGEHWGYRRVCAELRTRGVVASKGRVLRLLARATAQVANDAGADATDDQGLHCAACSNPLVLPAGSTVGGDSIPDIGSISAM